LELSLRAEGRDLVSIIPGRLLLFYPAAAAVPLLRLGGGTSAGAGTAARSRWGSCGDAGSGTAAGLGAGFGLHGCRAAAAARPR
jgi:hypothetical protein